MLTVREVADHLGAEVASVRVWVWRGRFPGARLEESPAGQYWLIPEDALKDFQIGKPGRPRKATKKGKG